MRKLSKTNELKNLVEVWLQEDSSMQKISTYTITPTLSLSPTNNMRMILQAAAHLQWNVPGHVDVTPVLVHPHFSHSQSVAAHVGCQVLCIGFVSTLDVGDPGAGQDLHAAPTLPHLLG